MVGRGSADKAESENERSLRAGGADGSGAGLVGLRRTWGMRVLRNRSSRVPATSALTPASGGPTHSCAA